LRVLLDAMGGDNAPEEIVKGCIGAIKEMDGFSVILIGDRSKIDEILMREQFKSDRLTIKHTTEVISIDDAPVKAIRYKKDSSMVVGFNMLKEKKGDVFLSAGNSGALMAGGLFILGRIANVDRPALAPLAPSKKGMALLIDGGANTVCRPINFLQFGVMGSIYMKELFGINQPKVGIISNGTEENKGTELVRDSYALMKKANINFVGNVEARQITEGDVDVFVCDGFVGNALLKLYEGLGKFLVDSIKDIFGGGILPKFAALIVKKKLKKFAKLVNYEEYGGVPLLGVKGKVIKSHGSSKAKTIKFAVINAANFAKSSVLEQIEEQIFSMEGENIEQKS
jgi:glycerol-3-phosphate acyltransferase PlsX